MGPQLLALDLANAKPITFERVDTEANWKYCLDTYGEAYHFSALHATTVGQVSVPDVALFDAFGPHHRVWYTDNHYKDCVGKPEVEWPEVAYAGSHLIFPNTILYPGAAEGGLAMIALYPGDSVGRCFTHMSMYRLPNAPETVTDQALIDAHDWTVRVVRDEDYTVSQGGQHNLEFAPPGFKIMFGRNEPSLQNMHRHIHAIIGPARA